MTDKIEVTQADKDCARNIRNAWDVNCDTASEIAAQHRILATRTDATPVATDVAALVEAAKAMGDDYMTSEHHHPRYVLVPTVAFEQMRQALAPFTKGQP